MKAAEVQLLKELVDGFLPKIIQVVSARLPAPYASVVTSTSTVLQPLLTSTLDEKIAKIPVKG